MDELMTTQYAVDEIFSSIYDIDRSSSEITKIIQVIDDISFQTNILAVNAAVEAVRVGLARQSLAVAPMSCGT